MPFISPLFSPRLVAAASAVAALLAIPTVHGQKRLSADCRKEVRTLCRGAQEGVGACIRAQFRSLSEPCRGELRQAAQRRSRNGPTPATQVPRAAGTVTEIAYGTQALQRADFWAAPAASASEPAPLVLFVHGGGWQKGDKASVTGSAKLSNWQRSGYALASVNYRLVPEHTVEDAASDVAASVAWFRSNAAKLNIDPDRIALVGHSAGAHLAVLVGTDPQWLRGAGLGPEALAGVVSLDGAGYSIAQAEAGYGPQMSRTYTQAFGTDPVRQARLSPMSHLALPNAPAFLVLHVERDEARLQSEALVAGLARNGTKAALVPLAGRGMRGHLDINRRMGEPGYPGTAPVDAFLAERFAR